MPRPARRASFAPRVDTLEARTLLSTVGDDPAETLLVRFREGASEQVVLDAVGGQVVRRYPSGPTLVHLPSPARRDAAVLALRSHPGVRYAVANTLVHAAAFVPNDPSLLQQWGLNHPFDIDVDAPEAWQITTGDLGTIVAVIDTGLDLNHPEFAGRLWTNRFEIPGNDHDDDQNGYVDDVNGWNFVNETGTPRDDNGHGTHVTGIIAANGNDGVGVAGLDWQARIMPLKFLDARGDGAIDDAVRAIYYAVAHGARVINASWGGNVLSLPLLDAVNFAALHDVVFVTAAGNESADNDAVPSYPANHGASNLLSVTAVDAAAQLGQFANVGFRTVDVAAPGVGIYSTSRGGGYEFLSGSSMAVAYVSGTISLLLAQRPQARATDLIQQVLTTAKPLPALVGRIATGGLVSAGRALGAVAGTARNVAVASADEVRALILSSTDYYAINGRTAERFVAALYRDVLGRKLDRAGRTQWTNRLRRGTSRLEVARAILANPAARRLKVARWLSSSLRRPIATNNPLVTPYANLLAAGADDDDVRALILSSDEAFTARGATSLSFVAILARDLLGRDFAPSELAPWVTLLDQGASRAEVVRGLLGSPEARQTKVALWFASDLRRREPLSLLKQDPRVLAFSSLLRA